MQHGRSKADAVFAAAQPEEIRAARAVLEQRRIADYRSLVAEFRAARSTNATGDAPLALTTSLLAANPDLYSAWNYRRELLLLLFQSVDADQALAAELNWLVKAVLPLNPKSYSAWAHRRWCLEVLAALCHDNIKWWRGELALVDKFLDRDARNFHVWGYRTTVLAHLRRLDPGAHPVGAEIGVTASRIAQSLGNMSAWHVRARELPQWLRESGQVLGDVVDSELDLLHNAMFTEPSNQSPWLYHRWLLSAAAKELPFERVAAIRTSEIALLSELRAEEPECKWILTCLAFLHNLRAASYDDDKTTGENSEKEVADIVAALCRIDPFRKEYYRTLLVPV